MSSIKVAFSNFSIISERLDIVGNPLLTFMKPAISLNYAQDTSYDSARIVIILTPNLVLVLRKSKPLCQDWFTEFDRMWRVVQIFIFYKVFIRSTQIEITNNQ